VRFLFILICSVSVTVCAETEEIPFTYLDGLIWMTLHRKGDEQVLNFLLDSGASVSVVDARLVRKLNLKGGSQVNVQGVGAVAKGRWPVQLQIAEAAFPAKFLALDLSALSSNCVCKVDGLVGLDFFRDRVVEIDYARRSIRLFEKAATIRGTTLPLRMSDESVTVQMTVNGTPGWFRVDTGCAHAVEWVTTTERKSGVLKSRTSIGFQTARIIEQKTQIALAECVYPSVPTGMHQERFFSGEDGLLGNPLLEQFTVTFDLPHARLILRPSRP
jgi:hypothetical protein